MESDAPPPLPEWARSESTESTGKATPWELWPTIGFSACIAVAYIVAQTVGALAWILMAGLPMSALSAEELTRNGGVVAYATLVSTIVTVGLCVFFARVRKGISLREYFALRWPPTRVGLRWGAGFFLYLILCELAF